jgi:hypothetical protein
MPTYRIHHVAAVGVVVAAALAGAAFAPATGPRLAADAAQARPSIALVDKGRFLVACSFSHRNHDDPIMYPRQRGRAHDHTYFGNRSTNAFSTPASLRAHRRTTCRETRGADTAAYWVPTLFVGGKAVKPLGLLAHYVRRTHARVAPFPAGLKMIAGDMHARSPQPRRVTSWSCGEGASGIEPRADPDDPGSRRGARIPTCDDLLLFLRLRVDFPNCWDGRRLDSPNHRSHMAYSSNGACPRSHPVEVPALTLHVHYDVSRRGRSELASGGQFSGHADFVNAWNQAKLTTRVNGYLNHAFGPRR